MYNFEKPGATKTFMSEAPLSLIFNDTNLDITLSNLPGIKLFRTVRINNIDNVSYEENTIQVPGRRGKFINRQEPDTLINSLELEALCYVELENEQVLQTLKRELVYHANFLGSAMLDDKLSFANKSGYFYHNARVSAITFDDKFSLGALNGFVTINILIHDPIIYKEKQATPFINSQAIVYTGTMATTHIINEIKVTKQTKELVIARQSEAAQRANIKAPIYIRLTGNYEVNDIIKIDHNKKWITHNGHPALKELDYINSRFFEFSKNKWFILAENCEVKTWYEEANI